MRRGLISRSPVELPDAVLDARLDRLRAAMRNDRLDALIVYTNNTRPAGVSWLVGFVLFGLTPLFAAFLASFTKSNVFRTIRWVGTDNYRRILTDDPIFNAVRDPKARALLVSEFDLETTTPEWALGFRFDVVLRSTPMENAQ